MAARIAADGRSRDSGRGVAHPHPGATSPCRVVAQCNSAFLKGRTVSNPSAD